MFHFLHLPFSKFVCLLLGRVHKHKRRVWLCSAVRNPIIWCFVENGKCSERPVQLGWDQVTEVAVTNGLCSSRTHQSQWPVEAHILTERAPIRPEILHHKMKDDYSVLCCIYSCSYCPLKNLGPARKIWPHRFNALWILRLHKWFLILAIIYFFKFQSCVFSSNTLSSEAGQRWSCKMSSWE